ETTDGGTTWTQVLAGTTTTTGAIDVAINPSSPSTVFAAMWDASRNPGGRNYGGTGSGVYKSTDGGTTWSRVGGGLPASSPNPDQHALLFVPGAAGHVLIGNDGGVYSSTANGSVTGSWSHATGLANMQFYTVGVSQQDSTRINGGLQDNGSVRSWTSWGSYYGG